MKLSKKVLKLVIVGSALAVVSASCDKEDVKPDDNETKTEKCQNDDYCEACGMG